MMELVTFHWQKANLILLYAWGCTRTIDIGSSTSCSEINFIHNDMDVVFRFIGNIIFVCLYLNYVRYLFLFLTAIFTFTAIKYSIIINNINYYYYNKYFIFIIIGNVKSKYWSSWFITPSCKQSKSWKISTPTTTFESTYQINTTKNWLWYHNSHKNMPWMSFTISIFVITSSWMQEMYCWQTNTIYSYYYSVIGPSWR